MTAIPRQLSAAERARRDEEAMLAGIEDQKRLIAMGQSIVPPEMPPVPPPLPGLTAAGPPDETTEQAEAAENARQEAEWRASGMDDDEISRMRAELAGLPPPELPPAALVMQQVEGIQAVGAAFVRAGMRVRPTEHSHPPVTPRPMTPEEMAAASAAVGAAKVRLAAAEESVQQAQAERAAAVAALEAARQTVAEGFAALMT